MAKPALPWLKKLCALYQRHESSVYECTAEAHVSGVLIGLELDRGTMYLLAHPKGLSKAYAETASMSISIHHPPGETSVPGNGELIARQFINILSRADKGDIHITGSSSTSSDTEPQIPRVESHHAQAARLAAEEEIKWAAYLGYKTFLARDTPPLVDPQDPIEARHQYLVDNFQHGYSRAAFRTQFGIDPAKVVRSAFEKLLSMGLVSIDGDVVSTHATSTVDIMIFRTFFFSSQWHAQAKQSWGPEFDPSTDYREELRQLLGSCG